METVTHSSARVTTVWFEWYQKSPSKKYTRGVVAYFFKSACAQANQQCHFKSCRWCIGLLDTDSCRGTVTMQPPMSNNPVHHLLKWFWCEGYAPARCFLNHSCARRRRIHAPNNLTLVHKFYFLSTAAATVLRGLRSQRAVVRERTILN